MVKTIDYYGYWNKNRKKGLYLWHREKVALHMLEKVLKEGNSLLDIGCSNGRFMQILQKKFQDKRLKLQGIDFSKSEIIEAKKFGLDVRQMNIEDGIKFGDKKFDAVYAGEIIEHLYNPDFFLSESNRILKNGGYLIFSTPNLCAWFNRILMPLGIQPIFLEPSTKSKYVGAGFLNRFKKEGQPVGHVRIFTIRALKDMLAMNHLRLVAIKGSLFDEGLPKQALWIDKIFGLVPSLASNLVVIARKMR